MSGRDYDGEAKQVLQGILHLLRVYEGLGASISQQSYKEHFFQLFHQAYKDGFCGDQHRRWKWDDERGDLVQQRTAKPRISRDLIWEFAKEEGWVNADGGPSVKRHEDLDKVRSWWNAWALAYDHNPPTRTYRNQRRSSDS